MGGKLLSHPLPLPIRSRWMWSRPRHPISLPKNLLICTVPIGNDDGFCTKLATLCSHGLCGGWVMAEQALCRALFFIMYRSSEVVRHGKSCLNTTSAHSFLGHGVKKQDIFTTLSLFRHHTGKDAFGISLHIPSS